MFKKIHHDFLIVRFYSGMLTNRKSLKQKTIFRGLWVLDPFFSSLFIVYKVHNDKLYYLFPKHHPQILETQLIAHFLRQNHTNITLVLVL